jgi:hypothetical protein
MIFLRSYTVSPVGHMDRNTRACSADTTNGCNGCNSVTDSYTIEQRERKQWHAVMQQIRGGTAA